MFLKLTIWFLISVSIPLIQSSGVIINTPGMMFTQGNVELGNALSGSGISILKNGTINCGTLYCPPIAYRCSISERTTPDTTLIVTTRNCTTEAGQLCGQKITNATNAFPGMDTRTYATASKSGGIVTCANCNGINATEIKAATDAVIKTVGAANDIRNQTLGLTHQMVTATTRMGHHIRSAYERFGKRMRDFGRKMKDHMHNMFTHFQRF